MPGCVFIFETPEATNALLMDAITLKPLYHRGSEYLAIYAPNKPDINLAIRKLKGVKWSQTKKVWYMPWGKESYELVVAALKPLAVLDTKELLQYLNKKDAVRSTLVSSPSSPEFPVQKNLQFARKLPALTAAWHLYPTNLAALNRFVEEIKLNAYSPNTLRTYRNEFLQLLKVLKAKPVSDLTPDDLRRYMVYALEKEGISESTANSRLNAIKFYFEQVLKQDKFFFEIPRPKKPLLLPKVLNEAEIGRLFNALPNRKHKAILFTAYSAGLRVSEVAKLKLRDIDSGRMQILIRQAKGKKDRYVTLSPVLLDLLRSYLRTCKHKPKEYLFESDYTATPYPTRTLQQIFSNAKAKAGIGKEVGIHSLRHSFATHLLEKGVDIRYIKDILGHFNIKTTERYLHVAKDKLVNIPSPLDDLFQKGGIAW
jgi:integrase/recombinase XerD